MILLVFSKEHFKHQCNIYNLYTNLVMKVPNDIGKTILIEITKMIPTKKKRNYKDDNCNYNHTSEDRSNLFRCYVYF